MVPVRNEDVPILLLSNPGEFLVMPPTFQPDLLGALGAGVMTIDQQILPKECLALLNMAGIMNVEQFLATSAGAISGIIGKTKEECEVAQSEVRRKIGMP